MAPPWLNHKSHAKAHTCRCAAPFRKSGLGFCEKRRPSDCCHFPSRFSSLPSSHSSPVSSRVSRRHHSRPDNPHPSFIKITKYSFLYHTPPLFLFAWHPARLRASRVTVSKPSSLAPTPRPYALWSLWAVHTNRAQRSSSVLHDGFSDISDSGHASAPCCSARPRPTQWPCCSAAAAASTKASIAFSPAGKRGYLVAAWYVSCFLAA
jgi:hypothetical protein